jgi:tetratricopeptide (TPR) repeat protein
MTSEKCRDGALDVLKKNAVGWKMIGISEINRPGKLSVSIANYREQARDGTQFVVRGFVATGDVCGDLEFYSGKPIGSDDADIKGFFQSYDLDPAYAPRFGDVTSYAQILYQTQMYGAAAPLFERALTMVPENGAPFQSARVARRVITDNAGMSYGIAGDVPKARAIFEKAIVEDPDYPIYYYNLACADAQEKNLPDAQRHLQRAFERKGNTLPGESMPDPTKDDSFLPYQSDKAFWSFVTSLHTPVAGDVPDPSKPNFGGSYTLTGAKGSFKINKGSKPLLQVVQSATEILITKTSDGKAPTHRFALDGSETPHATETGAKGTGTAHFKGKTLVIDVQVVNRPAPNGPDVQIHTREQWALSNDLKTLTIRTDVDFPNSGLGGFQVIEPWSEIYTRN